MAKILDGKLVRDKIAKELKAQIARLSKKPKLVIVQVGNVAESNTYISGKIKFGEKIGAQVTHRKFSQNTDEVTLISEISALNSDPTVNGIIVQLPLPQSIDKDAIIESIDPKKDVDGLTSQNLKLLWETDKDAYTPATTKGILTILDYYKIPVEGKKAVVVGRSSLVGKPTALALLNRNATVTVCHRQTKNLEEITKSADILVVATGKPDLITKNHVSSGQVVIDVGINVLNEDGSRLTRKISGDVKFSEVEPVVKAISPVPGGAGPMTIASLFQNLLEAYKRQI